MLEMSQCASSSSIPSNSTTSDLAFDARRLSSCMREDKRNRPLPVPSTMNLMLAILHLLSYQVCVYTGEEACSTAWGCYDSYIRLCDGPLCCTSRIWRDLYTCRCDVC